MTKATASNFADLMAIARRKEVERDAASVQARMPEQLPPTLQIPPILQTPPASQIAPVRRTPPSPISQISAPLPVTAAVSQAAPVGQGPAGYTRLTHEATDQVLPTLDVYSQSVLVRLLRLAWGFQSDACRVGLKSIANHCNISESQARRAVRTLIARGIITELGTDFSNPIQQARGTEYRIMLVPAPSRGTSPTRETAPSGKTGAVSETPNKENTYKDTHTNTEAVRVSSRYTFAECRKYADSLRGEGIINPGGYATKIHRSGEADDLISVFLNPTEVLLKLDASQCPDCHGMGFWEPGGQGKGVARCKHDRLVAVESN